MQDHADYVETTGFLGREFDQGTEEIVYQDLLDVVLAYLHEDTRRLAVVEDLVVEEQGLVSIIPRGLG